MKKRLIALMLAGTMIFGQSVFAQASTIQNAVVQTDETTAAENAVGQELAVAAQAENPVEDNTFTTFTVYMDFPMISYNVGEVQYAPGLYKVYAECGTEGVCDAEVSINNNYNGYVLDIKALKPGKTTVKVVNQR